MTIDRKLHLVPPDSADEAPPTEAEIAEAEALRIALEKGGDSIATALRAAHAPAPLDEADHEALLARALGDPFAPPTKIEERLATELAAELDGRGQGAESEAHALAQALRAAHAPRAIDQVTNERLLQKALGARGSAATKPETKKSALGRRLAMVSGLVAAAAVLALFVQTSSRDAARPSEQTAARAANGAPPAAAPMAEAAPTAAAAAERARPADDVAGGARARPAAAAPNRGHAVAANGPAPKGAPAAHEPEFATPPAPKSYADRTVSTNVVAAAFIPSRSTDDLFGEAPFPRTGGESARVDRIAMARASDLRQNRFAAWGVP